MTYTHESFIFDVIICSHCLKRFFDKRIYLRISINKGCLLVKVKKKAIMIYTVFTQEKFINSGYIHRTQRSKYLYVYKQFKTTRQLCLYLENYGTTVYQGPQLKIDIYTANLKLYLFYTHGRQAEKNKLRHQLEQGGGDISCARGGVNEREREITTLQNKAGKNGQ